MAKNKDFNSFLSNIEPSSSTVAYISSAQKNLRDYLANHQTYKDFHIQTFLSGSYAKHTSIRPKLYDGKRDVDIVVETSYDTTHNSIDVIQEMYDTLREKEIYCNASIQSHSVGIELEGISIDIAPVVSSDDEERYYIGSSDSNDWIITDPKGHIAWSSEVNAANNMKYKPLVKMLKWWRRTNCPEGIKYPKGIALEKMIADNLSDAGLNIENYLVAAMQNMVVHYKEDYSDQGLIPYIDDPSINGNDLLLSYTIDDFNAFVGKLSEHLQLIKENGTTNDVWRNILGNEFPKGEVNSLVENSLEQNSVLTCLTVSHRQRPPWRLPRGVAAFINAEVHFPDGHKEVIDNDGASIPKGCTIYYRALHSVRDPYYVKWQVVNTGYQARDNNCLRGGFENSNSDKNMRSERTAYTGKHYVQCFIIKNGLCVTKSKEFIINVD